MKKERLSRGNINHYKEEARERVKWLKDRAMFGCNGKCGGTREECLKHRGIDLKEDRILMKKQEKRYDSWMQTIKEGRLYVRKDRAFNLLNSCFGRN